MEYQTKQELDAAAERCLRWGYECANSFVRFLDFVFISDPIKGVVQMERWPRLLELAMAFVTNRLLVVLKARQVGVSWLVAAFALWTAMFRSQANVLVLSLNEKTAMALLRKCKFIYEHLPPELRIPVTFNSASQFGFVTGGMITALPSTEDAGRSEAATLVICDEWEFHEFAEQNYAATKPTIDAGGAFIGISTRNIDVQEPFMLQVYHKAKAGVNNFVPIFIDCFARPDRDADWFEQICREYDPKRRRAEYPRTEDEALSPYEQSLVFDYPSIQRMKANKIPMMERPKPFLYIYRPPAPTVRYVCSIDVGEGIGQDSSVCVILASQGMHAEVAAVIDTNALRTDVFARECYELCERYYFPTLWFEANSLGNAVANVLIVLKYPKLGYMDDKAKERGKPGFFMTETSRHTAIQDLASSIASDFLSIHHPKMLDELGVFQYIEIDSPHGKRLKPMAPRGAHDDCVMSLAIGVQGLKRRGTMKAGFIDIATHRIEKTLVRT